MSDQSDAASLRYLERVLRSAFTEAEGGTDAVARRVVVALLGMAIAQGGGELAATYVCPVPGEDATYEVRGAVSAHEGPDEPPIILSEQLNAGAAIRSAIRFSRDGVGGVALVGRSASGVERTSLRRTDDGMLEYLFPGADAYRGPDDAVQQALQRWDETLRQWRLGAGPDQPTNGSGGRGAVAVMSAKAPPAAAGAPDRAPGAAVEDDRRAPTSTPSPPESGGEPGRPFQVPSAAEIAEAIQFSLMEMTVDVNMPEMENLIRGTIEASFQAMAPAPPPPPPPVVVPAPAIDHAALAERIANRLLDRLPAVVEPVYRNAAGRVVDAVASRLDPFMSKTQDQLDQINTDPGRKDREQIQSSLEEVHATLATIVGIQQQLLAGVSRQVALEARAAGTVDRLDLEVHEMRDQARTWRTALQTLTEELSATTRRSESSGDRILSALGRELDEFGNRLRRQLAAVESAVKRGPADPAATEALNRLTARLARGEAQAELLLERLDQLLDEDGGE